MEDTITSTELITTSIDPDSNEVIVEDYVLGLAIGCGLVLIFLITVVVISRARRTINGKQHEELSNSLEIFAIKNSFVPEEINGQEKKEDTPDFIVYDIGMSKSISTAHLVCD